MDFYSLQLITLWRLSLGIKFYHRIYLKTCPFPPPHYSCFYLLLKIKIIKTNLSISVLESLDQLLGFFSCVPGMMTFHPGGKMRALEEC